MTQNKLERFGQRDRLASVLNSDHVDAENWARNLVRLGHHLAQVVVGGERESDAGVCPGNGRLVWQLNAELLRLPDTALGHLVVAVQPLLHHRHRDVFQLDLHRRAHLHRCGQTL